MRKVTLFTTLLTVFFSLSACSLLGPVKTRPINTYTLTSEPGAIKPRTSNAMGILLISKPTASPGYETADMMYRKQTYQLNHFAYHRWVAPPPEMLAPLLAQYIKNAGCFSAVVAPPFSGPTDFTLQTNITMFQQEFAADCSHVKVGLNITLANNASDQVRQTWVEATVPASKNTPYAGVIATNEATASVLRQVAQFVCTAAKNKDLR